MRLTSLLSLFLFVVIVFFAAPAASAQTAKDSTVTPDRADLRQPSDSAPQSPFQPAGPTTFNDRAVRFAQPLVDHGGDLIFRESSSDDGLCYSLRTYILARENKSSDATHLVRQVKCTPARKFGVKTADVRVDAPADKNSVSK